mgnify:CR=1 FL=1
MKAVLCGANGAMGQLISGILGDEVVGRVSLDGANGVARTFRELGRVEADVVIDFSHHSSIADVLDYAKEIGAAAVIGTTGHTTEEKQMIFDAAQEIPVFYSGNMSLGIALLCQLTRQTVALFPEADVEIVEIHHNRKVDAPSGTAKLLLDAVVEAEPEAGYHPVYGREGMCGARDPKEIGMHSLRGGTVAGVHEVSFFGQDEEVTLTHRATSRQIFVNGALAAAQKLVIREPGFYTFDQVMFA